MSMLFKPKTKVMLFSMVMTVLVISSSATNESFYVFQYTRLGCWKDISSIPATFSAEGDPLLDGRYSARDNAIVKCARVAAEKNYNTYALQDGGKCMTSCDTGFRYNLFGRSNDCHANGRGGQHANEVYGILRSAKVYLDDLGCWVDVVEPRAIESLEGTDPVLDGDYRLRQDAIAKCLQTSFNLGYSVFAIQHDGWCASSSTAGNTYMKYGNSPACNSNGAGGPFANQVYRIRAVEEK